MLIKVLLMLLYYYFINFNSKNIRYNTINIKDKTILNIAQPEILKDEKINDLLFTITIEDININNNIYFMRFIRFLVIIKDRAHRNTCRHGIGIVRCKHHPKRRSLSITHC